jgi:hypothetical protein
MENPMFITRSVAVATLTTLLMSSSALAASDADVAALRQEISAMKSTYESRIDQLEGKLAAIQPQPAPAVAPAEPAPLAASADSSGSGAFDNKFNPSIGVILNGRYNAFSNDNSNMNGFATGEEGPRGREGFGIDESELNFSSNIDDKFFGQLTASIVPEDGDTNIELEEAFVATQGGTLPYGLSAKAGRMLADIGYLNSHHDHTDDFADRPLPYRAFLDNAYNDDGVEMSWILPTDQYAEIGGGAYRGDDFPFGSASGAGIGAFSAFARIGGDLGANTDWRLGGSVLTGHSNGRDSNDGTVNFDGDSTLWIADGRLNWAPTGNPTNQELTLQGEYMLRHENGTYEDTAAATGVTPFDGNSSGWYAQAVYKFHPEWRVGARYSMLDSPNTPSGLAGSQLDSDGFNPRNYAAMVDWTNSEFSRVRLQLAHEELSRSEDDNQLLMQYIVSLGAHGAHNY